MIETGSEARLPHLATALPGPEARKVVAADNEYISPSSTRSYPFVARRGYGAMVEDVDGNVFLDFAAGIAVVATGHCHPAVVAAIQKQAAELIHMSSADFYYPQLVELAEKLMRIAPSHESKKVFYGNSGAEAIEAAIKLARYYTGRNNLIAFYGCFHGRTLGALSLTASKAVQRKGFGPLLAGVYHIPYPNLYRCPFGADPQSCSDACLAHLEDEVFKRLVDPEEVAAIIIEPIQGEGGYVPAPVGFLRELERVCRAHGILLVVDEVQSGMGRTGKWWACEHAGIEPDILCAAKGIASGMPLSATIARADIMRWEPGAHASTFGGNPVSIAAALATLDLLEQKYIENARRMGELILGRIADWPAQHKIVGEVRGKGLMIGVEFVRDRKTREPAAELRNRIVQLAFTKGLLVLGAGENSLRIAPPLVIDEEQAEFAVQTLEACIAKVERSA